MTIRLLCILFLSCNFHLLIGQVQMTRSQLDVLCQDSIKCLEYLDQEEQASYSLLSERNYDAYIQRTRELSGIGEKYGHLEYARTVLSGVYEVRFMLGDYDGAMTFIDSILNLEGNTPFVKMMYSARAGTIYNYRENYEKGMDLLEESAEYARSINDPFLSAILSDLGAAYQKVGRFKEAIELLLESIEIEDRDEIKAGKYLNISHLYNSLGNYKKGKEYLRIAKSKYNKNIKNYYTSLLLQEAMLFTREGNLDSTKILLDEIRTFQDEAGIQPYTNYFLLVEADFYRLNSDFENFKKSLDQVRLDDIDQNFKLLYYHFLLSDYYISIGSIEQARKHMGAYKALIAKASDVNARQNQLLQEIKLNKLERNYKEALAFSELYQLRKDSIYRSGQEEVVLDLEEKYEAVERDKQILELNSANEIASLQISRRNRMLGLGGVAIAGFAFLSIMLFRQYRRTNAQKEQLEELNTNLSKSLNQNKALLKEIHHRVKNNLQVVSSLLFLQSRYVDDERAKDAIQTGRSRVQSMSLLHQKLYQKDNIKAVNIREYFQDLGSNLFNTYKISEDDIQFEMDIDNIELDVDTVIPMGLIANELISNSLKHAFDSHNDGKIVLEIKRENGRLTLSVSDNGKGMPFNEFPERSSSMGVQLIKSFSEKLNAEVTIENQNGSKTSINFDPKSLSVSVA